MAHHNGESCCPLCGGPVEAERLLVDLSTNQIFVGGEWIKVQPKQAEILTVLAAAAGTMVRYTDLVRKVWGAQFDINDPAKSLSVHVHRLRQVLDGSHWTIITSNERGFTLRRRFEVAGAGAMEEAA